MRAADAAGVGELEDALGARIDRAVHGVSEARDLAAGRGDLTNHVTGHGLRLRSSLPRRGEHARTLL